MNVYITRINGMSFENPVQYRQYMVSEIGHRLGMREMGIYCYNGDTESVESLNARMDGIIAGINRGDLVICQFPTGNGLRFEWSLINHIKAYGGRIAIFIQDMEPLHYEKASTALWEIVNLYNQAEVLIAPTLAMRQFLLENQIRKDMKFVIQEIWDCVADADGFHNTALKREREFLDDGRFGLVWYKNVYEREYMRYGILFSLSRFLAAGIPVIVPTGISNQGMIELNHLGIAVGTVDEAAAKAKAMDEPEYLEYKRCVEAFAPAIRNGYYLEKCLVEAMQAFYRKDAGRFLIPTKVYGMEECLFDHTVLRESYGGNLALSWSYKGNTDGFLIYDVNGILVAETDNIHQHYFLIKGYDKKSGFIIKAYVETLKGKLVIAESELTCLNERKCETPKVSLIIPAYNAEHYAARCIDTALAQSFFAIEIIVVDDGSSDGTPGILDWYGEKYSNVKVIHQENASTPAARNTGIERASGEYIGFMDNDDMIHPKMIERLYDSARKNDCDIAATSVYQVKNSGYEAFVQYPMKKDTAVTIEEFFDMHFTKGCMFAVVIWNKIYRASLVKQHLIPVLIADDNAWTPYILSYADKICYLDDCSYEWDRKIRESTLVDKWQKRTKEELFETHRNTTMFYLEKGNPRRIGLLKQLARRQLSELERVYANEEYGKLWKQIEERFDI